MINGEPTENKLALASKGALHVEVVARGKMAHSAYPELGESAIDKLVEALHRLHAMKLPSKIPDVGACTKNVGSIQGGRAPNVISDFAKADLFYRLVGPADALRREITAVGDDLAEVHFTRETPFPAAAHAGRIADDGRGFHGPIPSLPIGANRCCWVRARFTWRTLPASLWRKRNWWRRWRFIVRWRRNSALSC
jgi:acetylornithine deacetylase